jgi:hypothetical protein
VEGEDLMEKPAIKLFTWKKAIVIAMLCIGAVSDRTYLSFRQKGRLDSVDLWAAAFTIAIAFCAVAFVGWWANREE